MTVAFWVGLAIVVALVALIGMTIWAHDLIPADNTKDRITLWGTCGICCLLASGALALLILVT
ncbi:MAG: hypothetical protein ACTHXC_00560 [Brachybacterium sp.]